MSIANWQPRRAAQVSAEGRIRWPGSPAEATPSTTSLLPHPRRRLSGTRALLPDCGGLMGASILTTVLNYGKSPVGAAVARCGRTAGPPEIPARSSERSCRWPARLF